MRAERPPRLPVSKQPIRFGAKGDYATGMDSFEVRLKNALKLWRHIHRAESFFRPASLEFPKQNQFAVEVEVFNPRPKKFPASRAGMSSGDEERVEPSRVRLLADNLQDFCYLSRIEKETIPEFPCSPLV